MHQLKRMSRKLEERERERAVVFRRWVIAFWSRLTPKGKREKRKAIGAAEQRQSLSRSILTGHPPFYVLCRCFAAFHDYWTLEVDFSVWLLYQRCVMFLFLVLHLCLFQLCSDEYTDRTLSEKRSGNRREGTGHPLLYAEAKKMKSLILHSHDYISD